jgi:hypothetical protein
MTGIQELQDEILGLRAQLAGKHMELAMALGNRAEADQYRLSMEQTVKVRRSYRIAVGEQGGGCYFLAAGAVDQVQGRAVA